MPEDVPPSQPDSVSAWSFGIFAVIVAVIILGWAWGGGQGRGWGRSDRLAHLPPPTSNSAAGPATKAWNAH